MDGTDLAKSLFFQAEDGIRDGHVTGVQTCALPICSWARRPWNFFLSPQDIGLVYHVRDAPLGARGHSAFDDAERPEPRDAQEIGRASCRERGWMWVAAGDVEKNASHDGVIRSVGVR